MSTGTLDLTKTLDLRKEKVLALSKKAGLEGQKAQIVLSLDFSGSMSHLYHSGKVQELVERILPVGMAFDDNGEVDFYLFHHGYIKVPENLTEGNIAGFINSKVIKKYDMGATNYAPIINKIVDDFAIRDGSETETYTETVEKSSGFLGLGKKTETVTKTRTINKYKKMDNPVYVIFITDGECSDRQQAEQAIVNAARAGIFFQFIGIGDERFSFLKNLDTMSGRFIDNANFFTINDLSKKSDDELYQLLLTEFPSYVKEARNKGLIK